MSAHQLLVTNHTSFLAASFPTSSSLVGYLLLTDNPHSGCLVCSSATCWFSSLHISHLLASLYNHPPLASSLVCLSATKGLSAPGTEFAFNSHSIHIGCVCNGNMKNQTGLMRIESIHFTMWVETGLEWNVGGHGLRHVFYSVNFRSAEAG